MGELRIKAEHINPFIMATLETFASMVRVKITPGKVRLKSGDPLSYDISGIIGLSGGANVWACLQLAARLGEYKVPALPAPSLSGERSRMGSLQKRQSAASLSLLASCGRLIICL